MNRTAIIQRTTKETDILLELDLDREGKIEINTGVGFLDHMLELFAFQAGISLKFICKGDLNVDAHHTIEDCALAFGEALKKCLGDKKGIERYGFWLLPMDESLAQVALDFSGRPICIFRGKFPCEKVGDFPTEMVPHFFKSLCDKAELTLNIKVEGQNTHHMLEACFKGLGKALKNAVKITSDKIPSTKGIL